MNIIKKHTYIFIFLIISLAFSIATCFFNYFGLIVNGMNVLPHIITFSTVILGVISLVFTIIVSIKDGEFYKMVMEKRPRIINQIFGSMKGATWASLFLILVSIIALTVNIESTFIKYPLIFLISGCFYFLIITTLHMLQLSFQLLSFDSKTNRK